MNRPPTRPWDPAEHLATEEDAVAYLDAALEAGEPQLVAAVLGDIARAAGMSTVAAASDLGRESLYKSLSVSGNPEFATVLKVIEALGLRLHVSPTAEISAASAGKLRYRPR